MLVFTNGCFDILHVGHIAYLEQSRALGKYLVVGLNSDASVRRLKGGTRPINTQEDRKRMLLALRCVDAVYIFDEDTPLGLIKRVKPDIITKGGDYRAEDVVGHGLAKVVILPYVEGKSTTGVIDACSRKGLGSRTDLVGRGRVLWEGLGL
jgi:D-beta-D-heptose 7-phosphate kinase/D-beta-D-heptose 1-phosphate adenosyltransferase